MFFCAKLLFYCTQLRFAQLFNKAYDDDDCQFVGMTELYAGISHLHHHHHHHHHFVSK